MFKKLAAPSIDLWQPAFQKRKDSTQTASSPAERRLQYLRRRLLHTGRRGARDAPSRSDDSQEQDPARDASRPPRAAAPALGTAEGRAQKEEAKIRFAAPARPRPVAAWDCGFRSHYHGQR